MDQDRTKRFHEVQSVIPESEAAARDILEAANKKAAEIIATAEAQSKKRKSEADAYVKRVMSRIDKIKEELS